MIGEVLVLRKCYQCGGETLGPVVKHSVSDSINEAEGIVIFYKRYAGPWKPENRNEYLTEYSHSPVNELPHSVSQNTFILSILKQLL